VSRLLIVKYDSTCQRKELLEVRNIYIMIFRVVHWDTLDDSPAFQYIRITQLMGYVHGPSDRFENEDFGC
jgi:hypothetical protein